MSDDLSVAPASRASPAAPRRATARFMLAHPARWIALGFGSGLSPKAPGTVGTLWAWASFLALHPHMTDARWAVLLLGGTLVGWWACTATARAMATPDPGAIVWDEVLAFWLVLWLVMPTGLLGQVIAFGLFRYFDAAKPGPVRWADQLFKGERGQPVTWAQGFGILFDDFVAAGCTLLVIAVWRFLFY
ncbi:phosphatidylglycerophosphatase A family protein [Paucibacter sp. KCTC 42545]|uniref:phosphatidylglycerophosphatase A family protein n=1 Tax=Paucibacter sp. KCTC 42545 TaxID=1768242 RepID=UPI000733BC99|nr:phosphatidylglycerophosphatase A [Paucibacter sp. KCTC 42545]ALT78582.1 phosphatidylglycerophosphatase [Paucibacter sp. KCTC 42545]